MKTASIIEPLETRIAPATLVNPATLTYTDIDGDLVTVKTSAGAAFVFTNPPSGTGFTDTFVLTSPNAIGGQQLQLIDLRQGTGFQNSNLTVSVVQAGDGDGLAAVGLIYAPGIDLGIVSVKGDLGEIDCGDSDTATPGLKLLSVRSMGRYGDATDTLIPGVASDIGGALGGLVVTEDMKDASIKVTASAVADAKIGSIAIGGSLIGGAANNSGFISAEGDIGPITIGRDLVGGDGVMSGHITSGGKMGSVAIKGSVVGGSGDTSGELFSGTEIGAVKIGGNLQGGTGIAAGFITGSKLTSLTIGGSILGGAGNRAGSIFITGDLGPVKVAHDVKGGAGNESGKIDAGGTLGTVSIRGSLLGGSGHDNISAGHFGQINGVDGIGAVTIGHDVKGGAGSNSASIQSSAGKLAALTIGGSLLGGDGSSSGRILASDAIGPVKIAHDMIGGSAGKTAHIETDGPLGPVTIGGSLIGVGNDSGMLYSLDEISSVTIGHDFLGGPGSFSGWIEGNIAIGSVSIGGSMVGGTGSSTGTIYSAGEIGSVNIAHDLIGGSLSSTAAAALNRTGSIQGSGHIGSIFVGGSIIAGMDSNSTYDLSENAFITAGQDLGSLTVKGSLVGNVNVDGDSLVVISARGQATPSARADVAIGKITIGERVEYARIFAGYDESLTARNADAQIGSVSVGGDWAASIIIAGAINLGSDDLPGASGSATADNVNFADAHDFKITGGTDEINRFSKIGSLTIAGQAFGQPDGGPGDFKNFGFVAEEIGAATIGGASIPLQPGRNNDGRFVGSTHNLALHEIGSLFGSTLPIAAIPKLVGASTVTYDDSDGDHVTVKFSKPLLTAGNVNDVFKFDVSIVNGVAAHMQLQLIDLTTLAGADGLSITVTVAPGGGDRVANVGAILASVDLGTVTIPGDLGRISAGDMDPATKGLGALSVRTLGRLGTDSQPAAFGTFVPGLESEIQLGFGALTVTQDIAGATVITGPLGPVTIGGSLIGGGDQNTGVISASSMGSIRIGQHLEGGADQNSGAIFSANSIASLTIGGSVIGRAFQSAVAIADNTTLGAVNIAHNLLGGTGQFSGALGADTGISGVTLGGSMLGGTGGSTGRIFTGNGDIGAVKIGHNFVGGTGDESGKIDSAGKLTSLTIAGSLIGAGGNYTTTTHLGQISSVGDMGAVRIGHDSLGGSDIYSGTVVTMGALASVRIGGSLIGGSGQATGLLFADDGMGAVTIVHDVLGGTAANAGRVQTFGAMGNVIVGGSLVGGSDSNSGEIFNDGPSGTVKIGHDLLGGTSFRTGNISGSSFAGVSVGGSVVGGSVGGGAFSGIAGTIIGGELGPVKIGRDLIGGSIRGTQATLDSTGYIEGTRIASVTIRGSIIAGMDDSTGGALTKSGSIRSVHDIGALSIKGSLLGNVGPNGDSRVIISAHGQPVQVGDTDLAIGKITVGGRVERANIFAGYTTNLAPNNDGVQIGTVKVGRDWIASNLVVGVRNLGADDNFGGTGANADEVNFGDTHDTYIGLGSIFNSIASIVIRGTVVGTATPGTDHFGFSSIQIGLFKSRGFTAALTPGASADVFELSPITHDVTVRER